MRNAPTTHILTALYMEFLLLEVLLKEQAWVKVHLIGIGATRVPRIEPGSRVIVSGLAGALDPALRVGDLVLDTPVDGLPASMRWHLGAIHTAHRIVATPAEKAALFRETGALAVDMEQATVCRAVPADVQVIGVRAISDRADMAVNPAVLDLVDDVGQPRPLAIARALLRRPGLIPHLRELQANSRKALAQLSLGLPALLERFPHLGGVAYAPPDHI